MVDGENSHTYEFYAYTLELVEGGIWRILLERNWRFGTDWSPTSKRIAISGLYSVDADSKQMLKIGEGGDPAWSPDENQLVYLTAYSEDMNL